MLRQCSTRTRLARPDSPLGCNSPRTLLHQFFIAASFGPGSGRTLPDPGQLWNQFADSRRSVAEVAQVRPGRIHRPISAPKSEADAGRTRAPSFAESGPKSVIGPQGSPRSAKCTMLGAGD